MYCSNDNNSNISELYIWDIGQTCNVTSVQLYDVLF